MSVQLILGPMYAGKTSELLRRARRHCIGRRSVLVIKFAGDTRYDQAQVCSHDLQKSGEFGEQVLVSETLGNLNVTTQVVCVDEGQFFPDLAETCEQWANEGRIVIVSALNGTFERKPFHSITQLLPLCDEVLQLCAVCTLCGKDAPFSKLLISAPQNLKDGKLIGGAESYAARCRACFAA